MISKGQIRRIAIDHELHNHNFKKFLYYHWVQNSLIPRYNIKNHKKSRSHQAPRNHNLFYAPITCIETTNHTLVWDDFRHFYAFIIPFLQLKS
jgi:hypothetical protein